MNQENEQPANPDSQYVMLDVGSRKFICIPMDAFIEHTTDLIVLESEGWGVDMMYKQCPEPVNFKLIDGEFLTAAKMRTRLLQENKQKEAQQAETTT